MEHGELMALIDDDYNANIEAFATFASDFLMDDESCE